MIYCSVHPEELFRKLDGKVSYYNLPLEAAKNSSSTSGPATIEGGGEKGKERTTKDKELFLKLLKKILKKG